MEELDEIRERYKRREVKGDYSGHKAEYYEKRIREEREELIRSIISRKFPETKHLKILEIGAGTGGNVPLYRSLGLKDHQIELNELLEDRLKMLEVNYPEIAKLPGDALQIGEAGKYDIIFQFTVFTSVLDNNFRMKLAQKMLRLLKPGGSIIWYDFIYNNPNNPDVKGVSKKQVRLLFPDCNIRIFPVTLAPPIGRRIGKLYGLINSIFPFLRTHIVAEISHA